MPQRLIDRGSYYEVDNGSSFGDILSGIAGGLSSVLQTYMQLQQKNKQEDVQRVEFQTKFAELDPEVQRSLLETSPALRNYLASRAGLSMRERHALDTGKTQAPVPPIREMTTLEKAKRAEATASAFKESEMAREATSKANVMEMKERTARGLPAVRTNGEGQKFYIPGADVSAGAERPSKTTAMAALLDLKDPVTAAMFANMSDADLTEIAQLEHKVGPLYNQRNTAEWFKEFLNQGVPAGEAAKYGAAVASGNFSSIPKNLQGKVGKDLALDYAKFGLEKKKFEAGQQQALVTASTQLAKDAGLDPSTAMQYLRDLSAGKAPKLPNETFAKVKAAEEEYKNLQITQLRQQIQANPAAVENITKTIDAYVKLKKEGIKPATGTSGPFSGSYDDYIKQYGEELNKTLSKQLGITAPQSSDWNKVLFGAVKDTWDNTVGPVGAAGKFATGVYSDVGTALSSPKIDIPGGQYGTSMEPGYVNPRTAPPAKPEITPDAESLTPQQRQYLQSQYEAIAQAISNPALPATAKAELYRHKLMLDQVRVNPALFPALLQGGGQQQQQPFQVPPMLGMVPGVR